ncbi:MAG TPA: hypothetical protein DCM40_17560, partial [Maribacter sp.]|nr:hypothetical protein [Maribacter sp.]
MLYSWKKWQLLEVSKLKFNGNNLNFIQFTTPEEQAKGLMGRKKPLGEKTAAIFVYDKPEIRDFWMKDTYIPLDIIFLDDKGVVVDIRHNAVPMDEETITSEKPAQYVIEVDAGHADLLG